MHSHIINIETTLASGCHVLFSEDIIKHIQVFIEVCSTIIQIVDEVYTTQIYIIINMVYCSLYNVDTESGLGVSI